MLLCLIFEDLLKIMEHWSVLEEKLWSALYCIHNLFKFVGVQMFYFSYAEYASWCGLLGIWAGNKKIVSLEQKYY